MIETFGQRLLLRTAALLALAAAVLPQAQANSLITMGSPAGIGILGVDNTSITNGGIVWGDAAVYAGGSFRNNATVHGNIYTAFSGQYSGAAPDGAVLVDFSDVRASVDNAFYNASAAAGMTPTRSFAGGITSATTVTGNGGVNVLNVAGNIAQNLTLSGSSSDIFVVNVSGTLNLGGGADLLVSGGVTAEHVLYNFTGAKGDISLSSSNVVYGTLLAPTYSFSKLDGIVYGEVIGAGVIKITSHGQIYERPFQPDVMAPEPGGIELFACGLSLIGVAAALRRARRR